MFPRNDWYYQAALGESFSITLRHADAALNFTRPEFNDDALPVQPAHGIPI